MSAGAGAGAGPFPMLAEWLPAPGSGETPAMTLSTLGLDGYPSARTVLLSSFDGARLHFHTDSRSRKVAELAAAPRAAVTLTWPDLARQLVVTGDVARVSDGEALLAYRTRTRYLQVLAWTNDHALAVSTGEERRAAWASFEESHDGAELAPPSTWLGFAIAPVRVSFWSGAQDGPSNRVVFTAREPESWTAERLPG